MNRNFSGAVLLLILAVAGLTWDKPFAVWCAIGTCVAAFLAEELPGLDYAPWDGFDTWQASRVAAAISWAGVVASTIFLAI